MYQHRPWFRVLFAVIAVALVAGLVMAQTSLNLTRVGNFGKGEGDVRSVFAAGSLVYYSIGNKVQIASFSNPASPVKVGSIEVADRIEYMVRTSILSTQYLVVSAGPKVYVINVQTPTAPTITSTITVGSTCEGVATSGTYAYIAGGGMGFHIYNLSAPASPAFVASIDSLEYCESVVISAPYAYIAAGSRSFIVDITTPANPVTVGRTEGYGGYHQFMNVRSGYAYICDYDAGLQVVNVNVPATPVNVTTLATGYRTAMIHFDGNYGYVANGEDGMRIINVSAPAAPTNVSLFDTPSRSMAVSYGAITIGGTPTGHIFNADMAGGMRAINVSNVNTPTESGFLPVIASAGGTAYGVFYANGKAYVPTGSIGLRILDVSTPSSPTLLGTMGSLGDARGVVVSGNYAYVAARDSGVRVIDVTNPASPAEVTVVRTPRARGIAISGNYVYVAASDSGIAILDITTPAAPVWIKSLPALYGENVAADGNIVGVTDYGKLQFYDVTNPASPIAGGLTPSLAGGNEGFGISGNYAYVPDNDSLRVFNLSNLSTPTQVGVVRVGGYCYNAAKAGNYVYVSAEGAGLQVVDVSNPASPTVAAYYDGPDETRWVVADGAYAYVAEKTAGLTVYLNALATGVEDEPGTIPSAFALEQNYPNPFNPGTTISFSLNKAGQTSLTVHNMLGQVVATLVDRTMQAGTHMVQFNAGRLASGMYFYQLRSNSGSLVRKMMLLK